MLKAPIPNASDGTQSHSLFLGNLSMFINEDDIEVLFNQYSGGTPLVGNKKMEAKIIRTEKGMSLGYGFINMRSEAEAEAAMKALNGRQFHGRPLQINWAVRNIKKTAPSTEQDLAVINSVHVKFSTLNRGHLVTEETLHHHFARYGNVTDVFVKYSCFNKVTGLQKGYAFVHYESSPAGKQSAIVAAAEATGNSLVNFDCQPSNNLLKQFEKNVFVEGDGDGDEGDRESEKDNDSLAVQSLSTGTSAPTRKGDTAPLTPSPTKSTSSSIPGNKSEKSTSSDHSTASTARSPKNKDKASPRSKDRTQSTKNTHPVVSQISYSPFSTSQAFFNTHDPSPRSSRSPYLDPSSLPSPFVDHYSNNAYILAANQQQQEQIYQHYQQQQYQQQQDMHNQSQYDRNQTYHHPPATLIPHADGRYVYAPLHPRFSNLMPPPRQTGTGISPMPGSQMLTRAPPPGYIYTDQQRQQQLQPSPVSYRTHTQSDTRFQPHALLYPPIYTRTPMNIPYGYHGQTPFMPISDAESSTQDDIGHPSPHAPPQLDNP